MKNKTFGLATLAALALGSAQAATTVKIATITPLSGSSSNLGLQIKNGTQLAVNEYKAQFAKLGMNLSLVAYDDQADPATGTAAARRIAADKSILAVVGTLNTGVAIPASQALAPSKVAMVSPSNTGTKVTDRGLKNMNRICARDDAQGPAGADFMVGTLKVKRVYVINDKTPYGEGLASEAEKRLRAQGVQIVQSEGVAAEERDFTAIITKIQALKPDAIYFGGLYGQGGPLAQQLRAKGIQTPLVGGDGLDSDELAKLAGAAGANNIYFTTVAPPLDSVPAAKTMAANFKKAFGTDVQGYGIMGYDSAKVVLQGILDAAKKNGNKAPSRAQVESAIRSGTFKNLLTGTVQFDKNGDRKAGKMYVIALKNSKRSTAGTVNVIRK
ncbi:branched-chain amino acid ABC transporter substrate-binding protein [Deinococcus wulumuqiensis]|uniref:Branched chain amino acid ABC transporter substrate-binding protein n=3 Tax=Deinococcus wulumuqiensis TaxID=980427 RepID=A0AAV4K526_9DEIO|nr:branched-chain amino acid ABC transporter substrate-binding protein [Deinococcus wulumuqiensis]QII19779.1 branched-chain amino acid ABC transporter substrate-binding protein [Deinococcus wulumuqiensis R12]GGI71686.1 branched chain amino acid ABC transporter substrate-binding protein [Deinococcus wulumuqiensis]GGP28387.1 branched chain amino acid ABC transporter substrate-binding protein [Deinococcus wulumuqiensis]